MKKFISKVTYPPKAAFFRLLKSMLMQKTKTPNCPDQPRLDGKLAIVTGGNSGIGFETTRGLVKRGAEVIILTRNETKSRDAVNKIKDEFGGKVHFIRMDLADIETISIATNEIAKAFPGRKVDLLVANAGMSPKTYSKSSQSFETAFAINVLGHHILLKACLNQSLLRDTTQVISVAGDIYILEKDCTSDYMYRRRKRHESVLQEQTRVYVVGTGVITKISKPFGQYCPSGSCGD